MTPHTAFVVNTELGDCSDATHSFCWETAVTPPTAFAVNTELGDCSDATHSFCFSGEPPASINTLSLGMGVILHAAEYLRLPLHTLHTRGHWD